MNSRFYKYFLLIIPLSLALIGINYGLPMHFIGDEEALIGGAMKMLELRNFIPATQPEVFSFFYYPPVLGYQVIIASLPVIIFKFVSLGFSAGATESFFALNQDLIWLSARFMTSVFSLGILGVIYLTAKRLYGKNVAILGSLVLSLSFLHVALSHWMRHWIYAAFFAYLTFYLGLLLVQRKQAKYAFWAGTAAGIGFGATYISALGLAAAVVYWWGRRHQVRDFWKHLIRATSAFIVVGGGLALLNLPELVRILSPVDGTLSHPKSISGFINFFSDFITILWQQEAALVAMVLAGIIFVWKRWQSVMSVVALLVSYVLVLYLFFHLEVRYVYFIIPAMAIVAGLFLDQIRALIKKHFAWAFALVLVLAWPLASIIQYEYLLLQADTRELAVEWVQDNLRPDELFVLSSASIEIPRTRNSLELDRRFSRLRAKERYLLAHPELEAGNASYVNLFFWKDKSAIENFLAEFKPRYFIVDYRSTAELDRFERFIISRSSLVQSWRQSDLDFNINVNGNYDYFNSILFKLDRLGPTVEIYEISETNLASI